MKVYIPPPSKVI